MKFLFWQTEKRADVKALLPFDVAAEISDRLKTWDRTGKKEILDMVLSQIGCHAHDNPSRPKQQAEII